MQENRFPLGTWESLPTKPVAVDDRRRRLREDVQASIQAFIEDGHPLPVSAETKALLEKDFSASISALVKRLGSSQAGFLLMLWLTWLLSET
jgi:hypothetical protein